jgi:hypothetical protein
MSSSRARSQQGRPGRHRRPAAAEPDRRHDRQDHHGHQQQAPKQRENDLARQPTHVEGRVSPGQLTGSGARAAAASTTCSDCISSDPVELAGLLIGQRRTQRSDTHIAATANRGHRNRIAEGLGSLVDRGVSPVLRYFGPPRAVSVRAGCRRPMKPRMSPWWMIGNMTRSRNRSMRRPVPARWPRRRSSPPR